MAVGRWRFWIDRGGTFTDCLGIAPDSGTVRVAKVLSSDQAPLVGIRQLLGIGADDPIAPCDIRMGTTIATNALLERRGVPCALVVTRGFGELLDIGNQTRPDIFDLEVRKPSVLHESVVETWARLSPDGDVLREPELDPLRVQFAALVAAGIRSVAVLVIHSYLGPNIEQMIETTARSAGIEHVSCSSEVAPEIGMVGRGDTTVVDAYLTPLIADYISAFSDELPGSRLLLMQSSGGLTEADRFRGRNAILSGPAGGVVAFSRIARDRGYPRSIGFDMGGTSTDVSCFDGDYERTYETSVAGIRLRAPMMSVHTVAAGGGSICRYTEQRFTVGPDSAGASPGPMCYARGNVDTLTLTDVTLFLGHVVDDRFPFPLDVQPVRDHLHRLAQQLSLEGVERTPAEIAAGFVAVADASMVEAIRQVSIARGRDVRDYALVVFGGAGGQHACAIAESLGIKSILFHRFAGVLSAYGMGLADVSWHGEYDAGSRILDASTMDDVRRRFDQLEATGSECLHQQSFDPGQITLHRRMDCRYPGTDTSLLLNVSRTTSAAELTEQFFAKHKALYGFNRPLGPLEIVALRVEAVGAAAIPSHSRVTSDSRKPASPRRHGEMWTGSRFETVPLFWREDLPAAMVLTGPALVLDPVGTIAVAPGFELIVIDDDCVRLRLTDPSVYVRQVDHTVADPVRLEVFNHVFSSISEQMGTVLRNTAISTNIRERLDFSCALFDPHGGLVANAPHIPVHLGAMGESVKSVLEIHPNPQPGSVFATNDPSGGGSHLPDITVVTPVHDDSGELLFFSASRGHHADVGGMTPGSMPPFSTSLAQEGVVFRALPIVTNGTFDDEATRAVLAAGVYPARDPDTNIADLHAQIAANQTGVRLLHELIALHGKDTVLAYMGHIQDNAAAQVAAQISRLTDGEYEFCDALDGGEAVCVRLVISGSQMEIDFAGSSPQTESNLNAPRAVTVAAVIYVLRSLVGAPVPLNSGCLRPVVLNIPEGSILDPSPECAVAGGNVETSQRIVDVLLGALGKAAASQGTMNNLTFGTESFGYYETIAGGAGATKDAPGASGVHTHMTNTRMTDPEIFESRFPVRLREFSLRKGSGGRGRMPGGDGVVREFELLSPMRVSILSQRRTRAPFGLHGGEPGRPGANFLNSEPIPGTVSIAANRGDIIRIETPGGGGYGAT